jgi:hypothetical protein
MDPEDVSQPLPEGVLEAAAIVGASGARCVGASPGAAATVAASGSVMSCPQAGQNLDPSATSEWQRGQFTLAASSRPTSSSLQAFEPSSLPAFKPSLRLLRLYPS